MRTLIMRMILMLMSNNGNGVDEKKNGDGKG